MSESPIAAPAVSGAGSSRFAVPPWLLGLGPLALLALALTLIVVTDGGLGDREAPPIETLNIQRIVLPEPGMIELQVVNDGPDPITIAQALVDDAYWQFTQSPSGELDRLESATIAIPYPWVQDEAHAIRLISSTGVTFDTEIAVAMESPSADGESVVRFGLVGLYVGIVPVALGLLWYPFMRRLGRKGMNFILALTIGLLVFLVVDMWGEANEVALTAPAALDPVVLLPLLALLTAGLLVVVGRSLRKRGKSGDASGGLPLSYQIALGIGLHNLGEGLAIGSAFALGEAALGVFLIAGFTLHNVTEGVGIAAPLVRRRPSLWHFVALAAVAGAPAILGTWVGAYTYSAFWSAAFLAIGVGAIVQVIIEVGRLIWRDQRRHEEPTLTWVTFGGVAAGLMIMYITALAVTA